MNGFLLITSYFLPFIWFYSVMKMLLFFSYLFVCFFFFTVNSDYRFNICLFTFFLEMKLINKYLYILENVIYVLSGL